MEFFLTRVFLGIVIGFVIGLTGVGAGILVLPALTQILKIPASEAVGTASLYAFLTKIYAAFEHFRLKNIRKQPTIILLAGAVPGALISSIVVISMAGTSGTGFQVFLQKFITWVMVFCAVLLFINLFKKKKSLEEFNVDKRASEKKVLSFFIGIVVGAIIGSTSVSGVFVVSVLMIVYGLNGKQTVGTAITIALTLTMVTAIVYSRGGQVDYKTAIFMSLGSIGGVFLGSRLSVMLPDRVLKIVVIVVICGAILSMFLNPGGAH